MTEKERMKGWNNDWKKREETEKRKDEWMNEWINDLKRKEVEDEIITKKIIKDWWNNDCIKE